jgi:cell wall assembly regulator SMI1
MPKPLSDSEAMLLCRTHQPSHDEIRQIIQWASANPTPHKLAPMLVLFTRHYASSQYQVLNELYDAMARCAASDATPLWECVNGDYDAGRVGAALQVLYRIGVETSCSVCHLDQSELAAYEARRSDWPAERDQIPITSGKVDLSDEEARAICRSFNPTLADIRRTLDWALAAPSPDKVPYILILQTENFAFSEYFGERMIAALTACATADPTPLLRTIAEDHEPYRIWAATRALLAAASPGILAGLLAMAPEAIGWMARDEIIKAAKLRNMRMPDEARKLSERDRAFQPHPDLERRKQTWPKEFDRLPRESRLHTVGRRRPESSYSTDTAQLTVSLERIRVWGEAHNRDVACNLNPGLTQEQIIELACQLPRPLPAEVCELYRWRNGSSTWSSLDTWRPFRPLAEVIESYREATEFARDHPDTWGPGWLPLFDEGKSKVIVMLPERASPAAPMYEYYTEEGIGSNPAYPSLTVMMAVHAEAYEELDAVTEHDWFDASNAAVERARQRHGLLSPDR